MPTPKPRRTWMAIVAVCLVAAGPPVPRRTIQTTIPVPSRWQATTGRFDGETVTDIAVHFYPVSVADYQGLVKLRWTMESGLLRIKSCCIGHIPFTDGKVHYLNFDEDWFPL